MAQMRKSEFVHVDDHDDDHDHDHVYGCL